MAAMVDAVRLPIRHEGEAGEDEATMNEIGRSGGAFRRGASGTTGQGLALALIVVLAVALAWAKIARGASIDAPDIRVIDGDTIRIHHKQPNVRLVEFNAPETRRAACAAE